ncbi:MAG: glucosamine-6-phosphate deaminase [Planctomycetes bacterium]|nr:glucosamine-6-phosphate deaminase [Planctomycetota bacterium]MBL7039836.1 glucosamine-6-phosphate deaminase [Pirellulaceae bacterium]
MNDNPFNLSSVETVAIQASPLEALYAPTEKIPVITVSNFPALGKLAAMRFLEWSQNHPGGVISLPTGKTPEHFINWVTYLLKKWDDPESRVMLEQAGVDPGRRPDMHSLHFVQIDEFYPIDPRQENSFYDYVSKLYIRDFGLDRRKALLMNCELIGLEKGQTLESVWPDSQVDLSLRTRQATNDLEAMQQGVLHRIDDWCRQYEDRIRELGGIGFFLGGIGPDGHIGFNVRGSDHHSTTRLTVTNYETQAAAAGDLGGIEVSRRRLVITIGLGTITFNPDGVALIIAAGEAKARVVADAIQGPVSVLIPASSLRPLPGARFYVTMGAAKRLRERQVTLLAEHDSISDEQVELALVDLAVDRGKRVLDLTESETQADPAARTVLSKRPQSLAELTDMVHRRLVGKIEAGSHALENTRFLHTEPHHDDLMLGYLPFIVRNTRNSSNEHHFVTLTSGFTAVSNVYMLRQVESLQRFIDTPDFADLNAENYFDPGNEQARNRDIWQYLDGIAARNEEMSDEGAARRLLRNLMEVCEDTHLRSIKDRMKEMMHYFKTVHPGKKDQEHIQDLKGMCREWEAECLWGYFGWQSCNIRHLRLGFYTGDMFTLEPTIERDVPPIVKLLDELRPDVISVALDPEASGPDTHYKVLQAVNEATRRYAANVGREDIRIWGYRNVWFRFHPSEANVYVPVSLNMFSVMQSAFLNAFVSQRDASFPSYEHDGPFCELAQRIQVQQYQTMKTCLGREWFADHSSALIRATRGLVFLRDMGLEEFGQTAGQLRETAEAG